LPFERTVKPKAPRTISLRRRDRNRGRAAGNPELLDERPPFRGVRFLQGTQYRRVLSFGWENLQPNISETKAHRWIDKCLGGRRTKLANDGVRCTRGAKRPNQLERGLASTITTVYAGKIP
jgi:hypothetical protein